MKQLISLFLVLMPCSFVSIHAQWRLFEVQGRVTALVEDRSSGRHIIVTEGNYGCMISDFPSAECRFTNVYVQSDSILRVKLPLFDGGSVPAGGLHGTSFRTAYSGDHGIVLVCDPHLGMGYLYPGSLLFIMPIGSDTFQRAFDDRVTAEMVCRTSAVYGSSGDLQQRLFHLFSEEISEEIRPIFHGRGGIGETVGGYLTIPPSDTVDYWRVSEDCGQSAVPYIVQGIPGREVAMIVKGLESHLVAVMKNGDRYVTYDRARSWLKLPLPPSSYISAGYEVKLEHLTNDSSIVLCLRKDSVEVLVYRALGDETWRELPPPPFPALSFVGGGSVRRLYVARSPAPIERPIFGTVTDSTQTTLALLDPTASVEEISVRPVPTKRVVHRGERLSFDEDAEWILHAIDGSIADHGYSSSIPFDVVPGVYFLSKPGMQMMVAVIP